MRWNARGSTSATAAATTTPAPIQAVWLIQTGAWALRDAEARFQIPRRQIATTTPARCQGKCANGRRRGNAARDTSGATATSRPARAPELRLLLRRGERRRRGRGGRRRGPRRLRRRRTGALRLVLRLELEVLLHERG